MRLKVLGCYGWLAPESPSTGFTLDEDLVIDGGTLASAMTPEQIRKTRYMILSHAHADHIKELPFFVQARVAAGMDTLTIAGLPDVLDAVKAHLFNNAVWPDFTQIGDPPGIRYLAVQPRRPFELGPYRITPVPVNHTVPCAGFFIEKGDSHFAYTADTVTTDLFWLELGRNEKVETVLAEVTFPDSMEADGLTTKHYTPKLLAADVAKSGRKVKLLITHMRPNLIPQIAEDLEHAGLETHIIAPGHVYDV